jgi:hypothetical protein
MRLRLIHSPVIMLTQQRFKRVELLAHTVMSRHEINLIDEKSGAKNSICGQEIKKGSTVKTVLPVRFAAFQLLLVLPAHP